MIDRFFDMIPRDIEFAEKLDKNCKDCRNDGDNLIQLETLEERTKTHPQEALVMIAFGLKCGHCKEAGKEIGSISDVYSCFYRSEGQ